MTSDPLLDSGATEVSVEPPSTGRRGLTARGTIINGLFAAVLGSLNFARVLFIAAILTAEEFGVWTIILVTLVLITGVKLAMVSDKYIQQSEPDQLKAFQKAFTLDLMSGVALALVMAALAPVLVVVYGHDELLAPALVVALMLPGLALQTPISVYYRRMQFVRMRLMQAIDPVVALSVSLWLALEGAGYWALIIGSVAGAWACGLAAVAFSPLPLRLRFERETLRHYVSFSGPLVVAMIGGMLMAQISVIAGDLAIGLAAAGAIGIAASFRGYTQRLEQLLNQTMYPAVCRVVDRAELMLEVCVKSNRLSMMWGIPFGASIVLFAPDLIDFVFGDSWSHAAFLLQVFGASAALDQIGFNWSIFYRALGRTWPIAIVTIWTLAAFCVTALPLIIIVGLDGFAIGVGLTTIVALSARYYYLLKLFPGLRLFRHAARALMPAVPGAALVLIARAVESGERTGTMAIAEIAVFVVVTAAVTIFFERRLLREIWGYVRGGPPTAQPLPL